MRTSKSLSRQVKSSCGPDGKYYTELRSQDPEQDAREVN